MKYVLHVVKVNSFIELQSFIWFVEANSIEDLEKICHDDAKNNHDKINSTGFDFFYHKSIEAFLSISFLKDNGSSFVIDYYINESEIDKADSISKFNSGIYKEWNKLC